MAFQILWLPSGWGGVGSSFTEFWFMRPGITRLQAGTEVATIYSNFLNLATWTLNRNKLITKVGFHTTTHHHTTNYPPQPTSNHQLLDLNVSKVMDCNLEEKNACPCLLCPSWLSPPYLSKDFLQFLRMHLYQPLCQVLFQDKVILSPWLQFWSYWGWWKWFQWYSCMWWRCSQSYSLCS